jgi:type VI secretion system secreted protein VgrG
MDGSKLIAEMAGLSILSLESQHNRLLRLDFPRHDAPAYATLLVNSIKATEELSRDFEFRIDLISDSANIDPASMMAKMATISMVRSDGSLRYFNGYITEFQLIRADGGLAYYQMLLEPWLAFTRLTVDCYSFHNRSVIELTEDTFADYVERDWKTRITGELPTLTCANQYNESDHNHLHRRWEAAGLFYWYEHRSDGHTLWLSDDARMAESIDDVGDRPGEIRFHAAGGASEDDSIHEWSMVRQIKPGLTTLASFDYKNPGAQTATQKSLNRQGDVFAREIYLNTGYGFSTSSAGDSLAERKMQTINANSLQFRAKGDNRNVLPGRYFKLSDHFSSDLSNLSRGGESQGPSETFEYLIVKVVHSASNNYQVGRSAHSHYDNEFTCVNATDIWRAGTDHNSRRHPDPGILTATVVGPEGEDIHTDEYGRVRVQFHWDRVGKFDVNSSQWIRVMTAWAGSNFGQIQLPRIGQEVVVQFVGGNVDNPIIIGSVYNSNNMPPWELPENKTQSGILTRSSRNGTSANANALRFEDRKGCEQLWLHAEKDQLVEVEHDEDEWIGNDRRKTVDHDETTIIGNDRTETVGRDERIRVGNDRIERVHGNEDISIGGAKTELVTLAKSETIGLAKALSVGGAYAVTVGAVMNTLVTLSQFTEVLANKFTKVGKKFHASAGDEYEMTVGKAALKMRSDGSITISGTRVLIEASGPVNINGKDVDIN